MQLPHTSEGLQKFWFTMTTSGHIQKWPPRLRMHPGHSLPCIKRPLGTTGSSQCKLKVTYCLSLETSDESGRLCMISKGSGTVPRLVTGCCPEHPEDLIIHGGGGGGESWKGCPADMNGLL